LQLLRTAENLHLFLFYNQPRLERAMTESYEESYAPDSRS